MRSLRGPSSLPGPKSKQRGRRANAWHRAIAWRCTAFGLRSRRRRNSKQNAAVSHFWICIGAAIVAFFDRVEIAVCFASWQVPGRVAQKLEPIFRCSVFLAVCREFLVLDSI
jgi:hypothetical protein